MLNHAARRIFATSSVKLMKPALSTAELHARHMSDTTRPFRVLGLQQVAIGAEKKSDLTRVWEGLFGLKKINDFKSEKENVDEDILTVGKGPLGTVEIDLMQPIDINKSPKVHIPSLNHIGLWVDDIEACVTHLKSQGTRFAGGIRVGAAGHKVAFIHPKGNSEFPVGGAGVLLELVQAPEDVIKAFDAA